MRFGEPTIDHHRITASQMRNYGMADIPLAQCPLGDIRRV